MTIYDVLRLLAATGCGIQIGGFLLLSLFHNPLFKTWPADLELLWLYQRFYRYNIVIALISGILAIFAEARIPGMYLAILGSSHVLLQTHLLPAMVSTQKKLDDRNSLKYRRSPAEMLVILKNVQITVHFFQLIFLFYIVSELTI